MGTVKYYTTPDHSISYTNNLSGQFLNQKSRFRFSLRLVDNPSKVDVVIVFEMWDWCNEFDVWCVFAG